MYIYIYINVRALFSTCCFVTLIIYLNENGRCCNVYNVSQKTIKHPYKHNLLDTDTNNLSTLLSKLFNTITESQEFSRADKGEICGIKDHDNKLSLVIRQGQFLEFTIDKSAGRPLRSRIYVCMV